MGLRIYLDKMKIRTGFGYDVHAFAADRELWLGGVHIPHSVGLAGHSDADVLIHAICDALLGAAGLGDIGVQFPDTDMAYKGIDSKALLEAVMVLVRLSGFELGNVDATVVAEEPLLSPYIPEMKKALSQAIRISKEAISIKATTSEGLGFVGTKQGIVAYAVVLIARRQTV